MRLIAALSLIIAFSVAASAQPGDIDAVIERVRSARASGSYSLAIIELRAFQSADAEAFSEHDLDYLLGRIAEESGDLATAMASYHAVRARNSGLSEYAIWRMSRIAAGSGNLVVERLLLNELQAFYPNSLLLRAADQSAARSFSESGDHAAAARSIENSAAYGSGEEPISRNNLIHLAKAYLYENNAARAAGIFTGVVIGTPDATQPDDLALEGVRGLDLIEGRSSEDGRKVPTLSADEHLRRGWVYQFNRDFRNARDHYTAVVNEHAADPGAPNAVFQIGRGYAQDNNFTDAIVWFERMLEQYPEHPLAKDALLQAAAAYGRNGKYRVSLGRYQRFIDQYPSDERLDRAYFNPIDALRDENSEGEALRRAAAARQRFSGRVGEAQALFVEARIYIAREEWEKAIETLDLLLALPDLGGTRVPGGTDGTEAGFLRAYVLEKLQRFGDAADAYLAIPDGREAFYGWRATERLRAMRTAEPSRPAIENKIAALMPELSSGDATARRIALQKHIRLAAPAEMDKLMNELRAVYAQLPDYRSVPKPVGDAEIDKAIASLPRASRHSRLAASFYKLRLYEEAAPEFDAAAGTNQTLRPAAAALYARGDKVFRTLEATEPMWRKVPADYQVELISQDAATTFFAAPFRRHLLRHSAAQKVDPRFLLAIMRQESRFRPDVKSDAAARGLMQFISTTSRRIADDLNRTGFVQEELYDPSTAILFGSVYVGELYRMFPNQHAAVAASYNGGEDNMRRWLGRAKAGDADAYVAEIAYAQTKDYVRKVLANYRVYMALYDEQLRPRTALALASAE